MRIVSLLGSATEIVYALGLQDFLVGISHECDFPPAAASLPRLSRPRFDPAGLTSAELDAEVRRCMAEYGSVYQINQDLLSRLRPDLVLTQAVCEVCAVPTGSVQEAIGALAERPKVVSLDAHTLDDILDSIQDVADAAHATHAGETLRERLTDRLDRVAEGLSGADPARVLMLEWLEPLFAPGHWVPQMVEWAGGVCLIGSSGERSREVNRDDVRGLDPDVLLIEPCGYGLAEAERDADQHRRLLQEVAPRAIQEGRAWLLDSAFFSRSGPRIIDGIESLARLVHPACFADAPAPSVARRWTFRRLAESSP